MGAGCGWKPSQFSLQLSASHFFLNPEKIQTSCFINLKANVRWSELLRLSWPGSPVRNSRGEIGTINRGRKYVLCVKSPCASNGTCWRLKSTCWHLSVRSSYSVISEPPSYWSSYLFPFFPLSSPGLSPAKTSVLCVKLLLSLSQQVLAISWYAVTPQKASLKHLQNCESWQN